MSAFTASRMLLIGTLGAIAALVGTAFVGFQKAMWIVLGAIYAVIGLAFLFGKTRPLLIALGPSLSRLKDTRGAVGLGLVFGLNIPACAAPLILALLGMAAAGGAATGMIAQGFVSLAVFGFALSLPLIAAILFAPARRLLDWIAGLSARAPSSPASCSSPSACGRSALHCRSICNEKRVALMTLPQARIQADTLTKRLRNSDGLFATKSPDGILAAPQPAQQVAVLWATSNVVLAATSKRHNYWHRAARASRTASDGGDPHSAGLRRRSSLRRWRLDGHHNQSNAEVA